MHLQPIKGNLPSRESRRKGKNRVKKPASAHTKRFRVGVEVDFVNGGVRYWACPPVRVK